MKLHPIIEKITPLIAAILFLMSHSKNVAGYAKSIDLQNIILIKK